MTALIVVLAGIYFGLSLWFEVRTQKRYLRHLAKQEENYQENLRTERACAEMHRAIQTQAYLRHLDGETDAVEVEVTGAVPTDTLTSADVLTGRGE